MRAMVSADSLPLNGRIPLFLLAVCGLYLLAWLLGQWILAGDAAWERDLVLSLNPDRRRPLLDAMVLAITDASMIVYFTALVWTGLGAAALARFPGRRRLVAASAVLPGGALVAAAAVETADYQAALPGILIAAGAIVVFAQVARFLAGADRTALREALPLLGTTLTAGVATAVLGDLMLDETVVRPRPLADANDHWNAALRVVVGERCASGSGYVSGHASQFFAQLTPLALLLLSRGRALAALLVMGWAAVHAWTRLYVAAHFPSDVLVGSLLGLLIGLLAYRLFHAPAAPAAALPRVVRALR